MSSADKLAFVLEATHGPLWKGTAATLLERLEKLFGPLEDRQFQTRRNQHFRWMRVGAKRSTKALEEMCQAIEREFGLSIEPMWFVDNSQSPIVFANKLGFSELDYDYAMQDIRLNQANPEPERLSDMRETDPMKAGIWLVERCTDEERQTRRSTCIFVTPEKMLDYRRDEKRPRHSYFAYLFVPFGGLNKNGSSRPLVTKYVGRGAPIGTSLAFHFNSEGRVPRDEAHMWIMASNEEQTEYDGGYVSRNIDKKNRPGVRWITLTFLTSDVSIESIDKHCLDFVRSADDLSGRKKP